MQDEGRVRGKRQTTNVASNPQRISLPTSQPQAHGNPDSTITKMRPATVAAHVMND